MADLALDCGQFGLLLVQKDDGSCAPPTNAQTSLSRRTSGTAPRQNGDKLAILAPFDAAAADAFDGIKTEYLTRSKGVS